MSWFPSWLPSLPSINYFTVPSGIQRRFISFILKRSLGHFLKPGQLDVEQIDSQIGSGYVQVNDLQLDSNAINDILLKSGLPLELVDGSLASVKARIPLPNPLTSTLGFSLSSLHLTLRVVPVEKSPNNANINLSDSVASYAESFIQDELTPREEASLRESFREDLSASLHHESDDENVPGGLNPFRDLSEVEEMADLDPDGVSLFATLIERLLAKFEFDAVDTKVTILDPQSSSLTLSIADISYRTEMPPNADSVDSSERDGESRTVSVSGVTLSACDLQPVYPESPTTPAGPSSSRSPSITPRSPSPSSSSDEEAQWAMSQSLAFLPPRPISPASSVASSMYQSAISEHEPSSPQTTEEPPVIASGITSSKAELGQRDEIRSEVFLSFGTDPIVIKLTTPAVHGRPMSLEQLHFCAIRPWHIRSFVRLADNLTSGHSSTSSAPPPSSSSPSSPGAGKQLSLNVKAVVVLLLPSSTATVLSQPALERYFTRPRLPPSLPEGYVRLLLDSISATASITTVGSRILRPETGQSALTSTVAFSLSLSELSMFASRAAAGDSESLAFPLLITDPLLNTHYTSEHMHPNTTSPGVEFPVLPIFDVMDWTDEAQVQGMKVSTWRTKQKQSKASHTTLGSETGHGETAAPAVLVKGERQSLESPGHKTKLLKNNLVVDLAPLQFFIDLRYLLSDEGTSRYLDEVLSALKNSDVEKVKTDMDGSDTDEREGDTPPATPRVTGYRDAAKEREQERRRLENIVLRDLDLDLDYRQEVPASKETRHVKRPTSHPTTNEGPNIVVKFPFIRTNVRCSSIRGRPSHSGAVVLDVQGLTLMKGQTPAPRKTASFEPQLAAQQLVIASSPAGSPKAAAVVSLGPLQDDNEADDIPSHQPLLPRIVVSQSQKGSHSTLAINLFLPSVFVNMTKESLDALQYWADDASQLAQKSSEYSGSDNGTEKAPSRDSSMIGSRYFAKSRTGSGNTSVASGSREVKTDVVVKTVVAEAFCRISLPRQTEQPITIRPFDIIASDIEVSVQVKPEGRVRGFSSVHRSVMANKPPFRMKPLTVNDHTSEGNFNTLVSLTKAPHHPSTTPQATIYFGIVPETMAKESRIRLHLCGFTYHFFPDISWISALTVFASAPPGAFETVVPSERTKMSLNIVDGSVRVLAPTHPGALLFHIGDLEFSTNLIGDSPELEFMLKIHSAALLAIDDLAEFHPTSSSVEGFLFWKKRGFALLAEITDLALNFRALKSAKTPDTRVVIPHLGLRLHLCADTMSAIGLFISDLVAAFNPPLEHQPPKRKRKPMVISEQRQNPGGIISRPAPDMIFDDLPRNLDYLDESFGAAGGLRELRDEDLDEFDDDEEVFPISSRDDDFDGVVSRVGGETIRMLRPEGLQIVDNHFDNLPPITENSPTDMGDTLLCVQVHSTDINVFLYDGYDWENTRKTIENEVKEMRKRLAKIRQLVAKGQTQQSPGEETSALLFNSVYIGLKQDVDEFDPTALIAAIDEELKEDVDTTTESSWQSLPVPSVPKPSVPTTRLNGKRLVRAKSPSIEFRIAGLNADFSQYCPEDPLVSRVFATVTDLEILDHIKTSTWKKFLTALRSDSRGNTRETDSNMVKIELRTIRPVPNDPSEEARLKAKVLPLRLHVDQDALDFMKKFFSFTDPNNHPLLPTPTTGFISIFPVDLKLDYKPRRVDYRALKEGKTIELMNFFHFDGAEMTLRHITLSGITGWPRLGELLNDLWTPDVKATQLVDVISGVAPIRSIVNVGSGIADLVLLPIAQYKKDGRIVHGVQKGTTSFVKSTAIEAIKLGAKLATGTQVILEQAEGVLGGSSDEDENALDLISKYADQPVNVKEGVQSAYKSLQRNFNSAAQTILAVPMEVYERSGNEGPVRSVIRAVPIAVLKPMIGASEAVSKTLLGLHNTLDPNLRHENDAKYKHR
ncbi:hypothetical protein BT96DRAFT_953466 [Gymnopus androsaceus JB14]|uniref:Autophagy-related protein 2 n=1 Tax=Gymnopus androsaceus JB14 TaxID=1447944 RepID=A0A6A4ILC1_9AGAR|nr:hypothetical protein BT96DRAFT_953466 [Gymnopus androsaceus JB14]